LSYGEAEKQLLYELLGPNSRIRDLAKLYTYLRITKLDDVQWLRKLIAKYRDFSKYLFISTVISKG